MGVIKFTKADILRSQTLEAQWASFEVVGFSDPVRNAAQDGVNYILTLRLIEKNADLDGKEFKRTFSSKAIGMMIPFVAACRNVDINSIKDEFDFDPEEVKGKKVDGKIAVDIYENRPVNKVEEYLPYKKGVNMAPAF